MFSAALFIIIGIAINANWLYWVCFGLCVLEKLLRWYANTAEHDDLKEKSDAFIKYTKENSKYNEKLIDLLEDVSRRMD